MFNRLQLMLDAKTLGVTMRNIAAMTNHDAEMSRKIWTIRSRILVRYGCRTSRGCLFRIHALLKDVNNV